MKIDSQDETIWELLKGTFFYIPRFQRPYAWDKENVDEFWNDTIAESSTDYFIGSMVLYKAEDQAAVVDGQQRLTTVILVLAALREAFAAHAFEDEAKGIQALIEHTDIKNKTRYVLRTETSYPFLQDRILKRPPPDKLPYVPDNEEKALSAAYDLIAEKINSVIYGIQNDESLGEEKKKERYGESLARIRDKLLGLSVISITLDNEDDAYIIFETLNTRGKDLTPSQLVKNLFAKHLKPDNDDIDFVKLQWSELHRALEGSSAADMNVDSFLLHHWLSKHEYINQKKLFKSIKSHVKDNNAKDVLVDLVGEAPLYRLIFEPNYKEWAEEERQILSALLGLGVLRIKQARPLLLAILRTRLHGTLTLNNAIRGLRAIEHFHFAYTAVAGKSSSGGMSKMYASLAQRLTACAGPQTGHIVAELRKKLKERRPDYAEFEAGIMSLRSSEKFTKDRKLVRYVLNRFEEHARKAPIEVDALTVEHLASQATPGQVDEDHVAMLGNLCLTTKDVNGHKLKNKSPEEKVPILKMANVPLLAAFESKCAEWNNDAIEYRTRELSKLAFEQVWS